jgi:glycosyltransferase involved in cell wall biosynthesis
MLTERGEALAVTADLGTGSSFPGSILFLTDRFPPDPGGLSRASGRLAHFALDAGATVHVLVLRASGAPGALATTLEDGLTVHRLGAQRDPIAAGQSASQIIDWLHSTIGFDLYHGQYGSTGGFLAAYHARLARAASYVSLRGNDVDRDLHDPARAASLLWTLRNADAIGAVSPHLATAANALGERSDVQYTPNSVDCELFSPQAPDVALRAEVGLDEGPVLGFSGELRHKKGAGFLLEAFRRIASHGAQLLLVGPLRTDAQRLFDALREEHLSVASRVRHVGHVGHVTGLADYYRLMDLAVFPSLWEGMPNAVLEAMACGIPVLTSDAGALPNLVLPGETGWRVPRHALHRLGDAVEEILTLPVEERQAIGLRGRDWVAKEFTPERERRELFTGYSLALDRVRTAR